MHCTWRINRLDSWLGKCYKNGEMIMTIVVRLQNKYINRFTNFILRSVTVSFRIQYFKIKY